MPIPPQKLVIALGGNAISVPGEQGTIEEQFLHTRQTAVVLADAILAGYQPIITHGNGPQVGNILRRVELAKHELYTIPLEVCVADTQAGMGYMISQCLMNELANRGVQRHATTIVTTVLVDKGDPAFQNPSKPIGPKLEKSIAEKQRVAEGWHIREMPDGSYRRIVSSPQPIEIMELSTIRNLADGGELVVCCGGGGIPVCRDETGKYYGLAAVIDKDRTTALLARELGVSTLIILTAVERVCLDYGKPTEQQLAELSVAEAQQYLAAGHFGSGSMRPKVEAVVDFVTNSKVPQPVAYIGHLEKLGEVLAGTSGTRFVR
jgi:carbamate kinase